ncbi:MAG: O-antigen ligase family protein [Verrucomicrobiota bacterium]|jgi:hypothetical protein
MSPRQLKIFALFGGAVALAVCLGYGIATESYRSIILLSVLVVFTALLVIPGYIPLLVFGLLTPFTVPLPLIWNFPLMLLALGTCILKYWLQHGLAPQLKSTSINTVTLAMGLFFAWVFVRYCMKPSIPNVMGFGRNVTGFRAYLNYGISFGLLFFLGRFVVNRAGFLTLMRWMAGICIAYSLLFIIFSLSKSVWIATLVLTYGSMFVDFFDNGFLRFVALPEFGLILLSLALLPHLLKLNRVQWWGIVLLAIAAVIMGGNRSSLGMAFIIVVTIPFLRGKSRQAATIASSVVIVSLAAYFGGPALSRLPHTGFLRSLALISPELALSTRAGETMEWRETQWDLAAIQIKEHPIIGRGYGGLENAFEFADPSQLDQAVFDIDLATGGIHNGYIACALAFGIPAALLFVYILSSQIMGNARRAAKIHRDDPVAAEMHCFVCAHLLSFACAIYIGTDLNSPFIWFLLGLGVLTTNVKLAEKKKAKAVPPVFAQPTLARAV